MHRLKAFTLIEVMVVVVIIGILASVSILGYNSVQKNARDTARNSKATVIAEALEKYYDKNKEYPSVAGIAGQSVTAVKQKLSIPDTDVLVFPSGTPGASAIFSNTPSPTRLAYTGTPNTAVCQTNASGYCDTFQLQYVTESDNTTVTINSRQTVTDAPECSSNCLSAPTKPSVVGSAVGTTNIRFTASSAACAVGSVQYKIRYNTSSASLASMPDWNDASLVPDWSASTIRNIPYPGSATTYYSQSLARCVSGATISPDSAESNVHTFAQNVPCNAVPGQPGWTTLSYSPQGNGTQYKARLDWWGSSNPSNCTQLKYVITHVGGGNTNSGAEPCGGANGTSGACTVTNINQGTFGEFWITPVNEFGSGTARYINGYAAPTITSGDVYITKRADVRDSPESGTLGFPINIYNSATINGYRPHYIASDNNSVIACGSINIYLDGNGNGNGRCQNPDFGDNTAIGKTCTDGRNFWAIDSTTGPIARNTGGYNFASGQYNLAYGMNWDHPDINITSATKNNQSLKLYWNYSGPISYVQMRYQVYNPNSGTWGGHQSIDNINEDAGSGAGYSFGNFPPGYKVQVWLFAANCKHKVDNNSLSTTGPYYWWPNYSYTGEKNF